MPTMEYILVTGGAGYIGSHAVKRLLSGGYKVVVVDNLVSGRAEAVKDVAFERVDIGDTVELEKVFNKYKVDAVMHFAGHIVVPESAEDPLKYYGNNVSGTISLLEIAHKFGVKYFIFSSSAAVYGAPNKVPIEETADLKPINPYGQTKVMVENILSDCDKAYGLKYISLRYFNASGADPSGELGEYHNPETHLIPLILEAVSNKTPVNVFGNDYPTPDGTCVRDYIHVNDLADAHILALKHLINGGKSDIFNLGNGEGFSVKEVVDAVGKVTGSPVAVEFKPRRAGDPPVLIAGSDKAREILGWAPEYSGIDGIVRTALGRELE